MAIPIEIYPNGNIHIVIFQVLLPVELVELVWRARQYSRLLGVNTAPGDHPRAIPTCPTPLRTARKDASSNGKGSSESYSTQPAHFSLILTRTLVNPMTRKCLKSNRITDQQYASRCLIVCLKPHFERLLIRCDPRENYRKS